jgi:hypothetical protein
MTNSKDMIGIVGMKQFNNLLSKDSKKCLKWSLSIEKILSAEKLSLDKINNNKFLEALIRMQENYINIKQNLDVSNKVSIRNIESEFNAYKKEEIFYKILDELKEMNSIIGLKPLGDYFNKNGISELVGVAISLAGNSWVSDKHKYDLFKNIKYIYTKKFKKRAKKGNYRFSFSENDDLVLLTRDKDDKKYTDILNTLEYRIELLNKMYPNRIKQVLINFSLDDKVNRGKRYLPNKKQEKLENDHVNGGVSIRDNYSYTYRKEEFEKVTLHELLHQAGVELIGDIKYADEIQRSLKYVGENFLLNETFVELVGNMINVALIPIDIYGKKNIENAIYFLERERYWSLWQVAKILNHFGFKNYYEFLSSDLCNKNIRRRNLKTDIQCDNMSKLVESTNVVSYYINRAIIYCYLNEFLSKFEVYFSEKFFEINNNFTKSLENFVLEKIINENDHFADIINKLIPEVYKKESLIYNDDNKFNIYKTMRMTATERNLDIKKNVVRKHKGINQAGGNAGKLKKGYKYSGKRLKSGLPQIIKCKSNKSDKKKKSV